MSAYRLNTAPASAPPASSCLWMLIEPQLLMFTATGGTKSLRADVNESDERLLRYAEPNDWQTLGLKSDDRRSCASPNVRALWPPRPSLSAAAIAEVLIEPVAFVPPASAVAGPQAVPLQVRIDSVGFVPPFDRS